jgi:SOS-response transcriptional repressor LexA
MLTLTKKQQQLLSIVHDYTAEHHYAPTLQEIADHMGICKLDALPRSEESRGSRR